MRRVDHERPDPLQTDIVCYIPCHGKEHRIIFKRNRKLHFVDHALHDVKNDLCIFRSLMEYNSEYNSEYTAAHEIYGCASILAFWRLNPGVIKQGQQIGKIQNAIRVDGIRSDRTWWQKRSHEYVPIGRKRHRSGITEKIRKKQKKQTTHSRDRIIRRIITGHLYAMGVIDGKHKPKLIVDTRKMEKQKRRAVERLFCYINFKRK